MKPIGYFVHHQGRGHAERAAAIVNALPAERPVTIFCARDDIFPALRPGVEIALIPSLFEASGNEAAGMAGLPTPDTLHCAPVGWPGIREAMGRMARWFSEQDPALMVSDVSAEVAQLARICSVPHVKVLQHGDRSDPGHQAAYAGAAGLLAPFHEDLAQHDWPDWMRAKTFFAGGLGLSGTLPERNSARASLGIDPDATIVLVLSGGGGDGFASAPLAVGARAMPDALWITIGQISRDWHATEPANLRHDGWVSNAADYLAAADVVISSTGNTTCQEVLSAGTPWLVVPEWRYFDEQVEKARALARAGVAHHLPHLPSSAQAWSRAIAQTRDMHDAARQRALITDDADQRAADWIERLVATLWWSAPITIKPNTMDEDMPTAKLRSVSALTIARGREDHLRNVVRGLAQQSCPPVELIIGVMQDKVFENLPETPFPIHQLLIPSTELPLAQARNQVAAAAIGEVLAFLDVDCIPAPGLIADYASACAPGAGLMMGEVLYLPAGATRKEWSYDYFASVGERHSDRRGPPARGVERCDDYRCFWSLNFAMHKADFEASGGFDERYTGYGGEDTDFGRTLDERDIAINWVKGARVYHQYHPHHMPPVHHLASVVRNAELFAQKWGHRTMEHWLYCFSEMGLIENTPQGLRILRAPGPEEFELSRQQAHMPYANTRRVMDILHARKQPVATGRDREKEVVALQSTMLLPAAE